MQHDPYPICNQQIVIFVDLKAAKATTPLG